MNKVKTETAYRVEYYDHQDKEWYESGTFSQQSTAFNVFLTYKNAGRTCRMSKVESKITILARCIHRPEKEE